MKSMYRIGVALFALGLGSALPAMVRADDAANSVNGVLIDQACGERYMKKDSPETAAEKHPKSCAMKENCAASGYAVISGKKMLKFDEKGNELAKAYLAKEDSTTKVTVKGEQKSDGTIAVTEIDPQK